MVSISMSPIGQNPTYTTLYRDYGWTDRDSSGKVVATGKYNAAYVGGYSRRPILGGSKFVRGWRKPSPYERRLVISKASTPCHGEWSRPGGVTRSMSFDVVSNQAFTTACCDLGFFSGDVNQGMATADNEAMVSLNQYKVDYATALAEARSTLATIAQMVGRFARLIAWVKGGKWHKVADALGHRRPRGRAALNPDSYWLEFQYGWRPLIQDLYGAADDLRRRLKSQDMIVKATGVSNRSLVRTIGTDSVPHTLGCRTVIYARVDDARLAQIAGMGFTNPLGVLWEVTPFSFVVDWFLPIGNFLDAVASTHGMIFVSGSRTARLSCDYDREVWANPIGMGTLKTSRSGRSSTQGLHLRRSVIGSWPIAFPLVNTRPFGPERTLSGLSLSTQWIRRTRRGL